MPGKDRASPGEALLFLDDVRQRLTIVALDSKDYLQLLEEAAANSIWGGGIYDAIAGGCALRADAETIYTWNVKHFQRLGPNIAPRVSTP